MSYKIKESGRSMVEMLGVLAIIGVLSITGIASFSIAMAKHKANEAAQQTSLAYVQVEEAAALGTQGTMHLNTEGNTTVSLGGTSLPNAGLKVDFGNDVAACKQFVAMYEGHSDFYVLGKCE